MKLTRGLAHLCTLLAVLASLSLTHAQDSAGKPSTATPDAIDSPEVAQELAQAAKNFIDTVDPSLQATYFFKDAERESFHFFPIARRGVSLKQLKPSQQQLGLALMSAALSHAGNEKALTIMSLGDYLHDHDKTPNPHRDSDQYYFTIFGDPTPQGTWGYRVEGFHLSLNVTVVNGRYISVTPSFFGAIPAIVPDGPRKGLQVLREEQDLGRELAKSFTPEQRKTGFGPLPDFKQTVGGLITGNQPRIQRDKPKGIPVSQMTTDQRETLMKLIRTHIGRIRKELADQDLARIDRAGTDTIHFEWSGGLEPGQPHHYLIQGPTFLIEYDNTQDNANHVHTVYRDFDNDFGDALLRHYQQYHRQPATTQATARPALEEIELHYGIYLARLELRVNVSPDGWLRSVRTENKSYGSKDIDPKTTRVETREGRLTAEQIADLAERFAEWNSFSSEPYTGHPDGGEVSIHYGKKTVSGGDLVPKQVDDIRVQLMELAKTMPIVKS